MRASRAEQAGEVSADRVVTGDGVVVLLDGASAYLEGPAHRVDDLSGQHI